MRGTISSHLCLMPGAEVSQQAERALVAPPGVLTLRWEPVSAHLIVGTPAAVAPLEMVRLQVVPRVGSNA